MPCFHIREDLFRRPMPPRREIIQPALNTGDGCRVLLRVIVWNRLHIPKQNRFVQKRQQKRFRLLPVLRGYVSQLLFLTVRNL